MAELRIATACVHAVVSLFSDLENFSVFKPDPRREESVSAMFDELVAWGGALKSRREI